MDTRLLAHFLSNEPYWGYPEQMPCDAPVGGRRGSEVKLEMAPKMGITGHVGDVPGDDEFDELLYLLATYEL